VALVVISLTHPLQVQAALVVAVALAILEGLLAVLELLGRALQEEQDSNKKILALLVEAVAVEQLVATELLALQVMVASVFHPQSLERR
jgi:hypothetical protein